MDDITSHFRQAKEKSLEDHLFFWEGKNQCRKNYFLRRNFELTNSKRPYTSTQPINKKVKQLTVHTNQTNRQRKSNTC